MELRLTNLIGFIQSWRNELEQDENEDLKVEVLNKVIAILAKIRIKETGSND